MPAFVEYSGPVPDPFPLVAAGSITVTTPTGKTPTRLLGFANYASSNQTVTVALTDLTGKSNLLPQIGSLAASQFVLMPGSGIWLYNGLIAIPSGVPIAPGIVLFVK